MISRMCRAKMWPVLVSCCHTTANCHHAFALAISMCYSPGLSLINLTMASVPLCIHQHARRQLRRPLSLSYILGTPTNPQAALF